MATLVQLSTRMRALAERLPEIADQAKRVVVSAMLESLFENTPADTSKLVSNWRVSSGPVNEPLEAYSHGEHGSTREASIAAAKAVAKGALDAIPLGSPIVIYNTVPYVRYVNDGSSGQAPRLFVETARLVGRLAGTQFKRSVGVTRG